MPFSFKPTDAEINKDNSLAEYAERAGKSIGEKIGIFLIIIFFLTIFLAVGMFYYNFYLTKQLNQNKERLISYDKKLLNELGGVNIEEIKSVSKKFQSLNQMINDHAYVSSLFKVLEYSVENMSTFTKFDLTYDENLKSYVLNLSAQAPNYHSVIQQVDTLKREPYSKYLSNVEVKSMSPDQTGYINFSIKMNTAIKGVLPENTLTDTAIDRLKNSDLKKEVEEIFSVNASSTPSNSSTTTEQASKNNTVSSKKP